ncbi:uncharacterized protein LOC127836132 [Dreissena polymorpha]|uniref:Uncharacterized protein n=1 Tax=Dreissena polymorpha TaxID=45954 RepID=A0A9D4GGJ6_DREPO|nr:uncharacterized protein LOC127836132 [Dreissena polymorpha]KAH3813602.1 hypothetical protein DPMN_142066 [Dreissena polymorpha]
MADLRMFACLIFAFFCTGIVTVPVKHTHSVSGTDTYKIRVSISSGKVDPQWTLDGNTSNPDIKTLIKYITNVGHSMGHSETPKAFPDVSGYRGIEIDHMVDGKSQHVWVIPRCELIKLEYLLMNLTAGNDMSADQKSHAYGVLTKCMNAKKLDGKPSTNKTAETHAV